MTHIPASSALSPTMVSAPPEFGQHTGEVLAEVGYSAADIATSRKNKVI